MAKRKTKSKKKTENTEPNAFWQMTGAILLFVIAFLLLLGGFGTGGDLPKNLFEGAYWALGWAAYLTPIALGYLGALKFTSEDKNIPLDKLLSMSASVIFAGSFFYVAFANKVGDNFIGGHGGEIGRVVGSTILNALDRWPASLLFLIFAVLGVLYTFHIHPRVLLKLFEPFKKKKEDTDLGMLKQKAGEFQLNEGVPVEHRSPRLGSLKNAAEKVAPAADHQALTVASDPNWKFPPLDLLNQKQDKADAGDIEGNAKAIKETFANFNIEVDMEGANVGPRVTQFTLKPPTGVKLTKITALENNLALDLAAPSIRMEAPIPGKRAVGIEVPNVKAATVSVHGLLTSQAWGGLNSPLPIAIGKDISGSPVVADLDKMPHLLIAGQTGAGKSVMINTILTSLLYRNSPADLKLILVDPKQVEMNLYSDIPHLLAPVVHEPEKCISALKWAVSEMERRLKAFREVGKRNIGEYNALKKEEGMPYIVIVIDELADLMMMAARDVEALVVRIAQKARAAGIHLVIATQRPSVDVITGLIKANVPGRIAFTVVSQVDSRTIIDQAGAEKLLGSGDMLFSLPQFAKPIRIQAALTTDTETNKVCDFLRKQRAPEYDDEVVSQPVQLGGGRSGAGRIEVDAADEPIFEDAVRVVVEARKASTSLLQRRLRIGYGKAARLIESMEEQGIVGPADGSRPREVLVNSVDDVLGRRGDEPQDVYDEISSDDETKDE